MSHPPGSDIEHVSQLGFDRLLAGETQGTEDLRAHLSQCEQCRKTYETLEAERREHLSDKVVARRVDALVAALDERAEASQDCDERSLASRARRWLARWHWWVQVAAAAAIALLILWPEQRDTKATEQRDSQIRRSVDIDDAPKFQVLVVEEDQSAHLLGRDERLASGATLEFRALCVQHCYVLVEVIDTSESAQDPPMLWQLKPKKWNRLPMRIEVDAPLQLAALFCKDTPEQDPWPAKLEDPHSIVPEGCILRTTQKVQPR